MPHWLLLVLVWVGSAGFFTGLGFFLERHDKKEELKFDKMLQEERGKLRLQSEEMLANLEVKLIQQRNNLVAKEILKALNIEYIEQDDAGMGEGSHLSGEGV